MRTYSALHNELETFLTDHLSGLENSQRTEALRWYCQGLGLGANRKTIQGMSLSFGDSNQEGTRQRLQRAIGSGRFDAKDIFARLQKTVMSSGEVQAYCIDDTGVAKKGTHSVGVQRQYSGTLGKVGNCQVITSLHGVSDVFGACLGLQLYLPKDWATDEERREVASIPSEVSFKKKWQIALELLDDTLSNGGGHLPVLADAGYGDCREFRDELEARGLSFVVGISSQTTVWKADTELHIPKSTKQGRPAKRWSAKDGSEPLLVEELAMECWANHEFRKVTWRKGTKGMLSSSFKAIRVISAEKRTKGKKPSSEMWLLMEREKDGFKYYFASHSKSTALKTIVRLAKMRWHIERDYQDMKQNLGFDRYEGRSWGGLHRHLAMVAIMHAFISLHREAFSPCGEYAA